MLLNIYCNDWMDFDDGTCCRSAEAATALQMFTLFILFLWYGSSSSQDIQISVNYWMIWLLNDYSFDCAAVWLVYRSFRSRRKKLFHQIEPIETILEEEGALVHADGELLVPNGALLKTKKVLDTPNWQSLISSFGKLGLIMAYFYLCDR